MADRIIELRTKRGKAIDDGRGVITAAEKEGRASLNEDEQRKYDLFIKEATDLGVEIEREERQRKLEAESRAILTEIESPETRGAVEAEELPARFAEFRKSPFAAKGYGAAFRSYLRGGATMLGQDEARSLQAGNDNLGGALVAPMQFVARLIKAVDDLVFIRQHAQVVPVTGSDSLGMPYLATDLGDADWTTELQTGNEDDMRFGGRELKPNPMAKLVKVSNKLMRVSTLDPEGLVIQRGAYKIGVTEEKAFLTGNGVGRALGVFTASDNGIPTSRDVSTGNTATAITATGLISAKYALKAQYRRTARWLFHRDAMAQIAKLTDGMGQYLWRESLREGEPAMLCGLPYDESEFAPNTFTTGLYVGLLADWSNGYMIADSLGVTVQRLVELYAETNKIGFIFRKETDGMPILGEAFSRVKLA